jgi:hypothetical protein
MNMLEFVAVKDSILKFIQTHHNEAIDTDSINKELQFRTQPNGVVEACIEEMHEDKAIILHNVKGKNLVILSEPGRKLLDEGGYTYRYIETKKEKIYTDSINLPPVESEHSNRKQVSVAAVILGFIALFESVLFKRI